VRKAAKPRQKVTSKVVSVVHPADATAGEGTADASVERRSQWRVVLIPKGRVLEDDDGGGGDEAPATDSVGPEYVPEIAVEYVAGVDGQDDAAFVAGFRCVVVGDMVNAAEAEAQVLHDGSQSGLGLRLPDAIRPEPFRAAEGARLAITLEILEGSAASAASGAELFGSLAAVASQLSRAVSVSEARGISASVAPSARAESVATPSTPASRVEPTAPADSTPAPSLPSAPSAPAVDPAVARAWSSAFSVLALDGAAFPAAWRGHEFEWCQLLLSVAGALAAKAPEPDVTSADAVDAVVRRVSQHIAADIGSTSYPDVLPEGLEIVERAREAFPVLRKLPTSSAGWHQFAAVANIAALQHPRRAGSVLAAVGARCSLEAKPVGAGQKQSSEAIAAHLDLLAELRSQVQERQWQRDASAGPLVDSATSTQLTEAVASWRRDVDEVEADLTAASKARARLSAAPPHRAALSAVRTAAEEAASTKAALSDCRASRDSLVAVADLAAQLSDLTADSLFPGAS
jgi:hypothetical protein